MKETASLIFKYIKGFLGILILVLIIYILFDYISSQTVKVAVYENETEILTIKYERNGKSFAYSFHFKEHDGVHASGADFIDENTAVFDGQYALPSCSLYAVFKFYDGYVEYYENDELCRTLFFVTDINIR